MDLKLTEQEFAEFQEFFITRVTRTIESLPFHFQIPVRMTHIPGDMGAVLGPSRILGALVCAGSRPDHIELDFRFVLKCFLDKELGEQKLATVLCHELAHIVIRDHSATHATLFQFCVLSVLFQWNPPQSADALRKLLATAESIQTNYALGGELLCSRDVTLARFTKPGRQLPVQEILE